MKRGESWVIIETEPSGMKPPVCAVEIAAQRMAGWEPEGLSFRVLLNHSVPIEIQAQAVHGYGTEHLRQHGQDPLVAHRLFRDYVGSRPVVSHNLPMDWDRLLVPEFQRLGVPQPGVKGFCAMMLARRALPECSGFSLSALNKRLRLVEGNLQGAQPDVQALVRLFRDYLGPRLTAAGIVGFEAVAEFARRSPIAKCHQLIREISRSLDVPAAAPTPGPAPVPPPGPTPEQSVQELYELARNIMADGRMTTPEFLLLVKWLQECPHTDVHPINRLYEIVECIAQDGRATPDEQQELEGAFRRHLNKVNAGTELTVDAPVSPEPVGQHPPREPGRLA